MSYHGSLEINVLSSLFGVGIRVPLATPLPVSVLCACDCGCAGNASGGGPRPIVEPPSMPAKPEEIGAGVVRYATGELVLQATDLASGGFGTPWGHRRSFASRLDFDDDLGQGFNWLIAQLPYVVGSGCDSVVVMGDANAPLWFDWNGQQYVGRYGIPQQLLGGQDGPFQLVGRDGSMTNFTGLGDTPPGVFVNHTDAAGNVTQVVGGYNGLSAAEVQRNGIDADGNKVVESYLYGFYSSELTSVLLRRQVNGGAWSNVRQVLFAYWDGSNSFGSLNDLATAEVQAWQNCEWVSLGTTLYRYYLPPAAGGASSASSGSSSSAGGGESGSSSSSSSSGAGQDDSRGLGHLVKYALDPDSYARLAADPNAGEDPAQAPDWVVAMYADYYFEYDGERRAALVSLEGGSRTYNYDYPASAFGPGDTNAWTNKTLETLPGGTQNTTYANSAAQVMLSVKVAGAGEAGNGPWYQYFRYDDHAHMVVKAESSAVTGYNESYADLLNCQATSSSSSSSSSGSSSVCNCPPICCGNLEYLADAAGLIHLYDYDPASGFVVRERIRNGEFGSDNKLWERGYLAYVLPASSSSPPSSSSSSISSSSSSSSSVGSSSSSSDSSSSSSSSVSSSSSSSDSASSSSSESSASSSSSSGGVPPAVVYVLQSLIQYPDDITVDPAQSRQVVTSYAYTFYDGTGAVQSRTTIWPVVSTEQNGSGAADGRVEFFDAYGNLVWTQDERGFIHYQAFDASTGAVIQMIADFDTTLPNQPTPPTGWSTPSGVGLNLVTDMTVDTQGRTTQVLGPWHTIDISGVATSIRRATWTVYQDSVFQTWTGQGYATGSAGDYTFTLINPVSITITDEGGRVTDQISAVRDYTNGALVASDSFPQSSYCRWTTNQYTDCCKLASTRVYYAIPASGVGVQGVNYNETDYGYDFLNRRNRLVSPGGTITRTVFDARDLPISVWVGTNDNGATAGDPTGGAAPGNNMIVVTENEYDNGLAGGEGNLTAVTQYVDATTSRVTSFDFDWRDRQVQVTAAQDWYQITTLDNMSRASQVQQYAQATNLLIRQSQTLYDGRSRVYQTIRYAVDPSTGDVGNSLVDNTWYDPSGSAIKQLPYGSSAFTKTVIDGAGRQIVQYFGYTPSSSSSSSSSSNSPLSPGEGQGEGGVGSGYFNDPTNDIVVEQTETVFDDASNAIQTTFRQRYHNATGTGPLTSPGGAQPVARVTYVAIYPDALGRQQAEANYGTNGDVALAPPSTIPASADTVLVTLTVCNSRGEAYQTIDPAGRLDQTTFDDAGRRIELVLNVQASSSISSSSSGGLPTSDDQNNTTLWSYTADSQIATLTAVNSATGDQVTTYGYGTSLASSDVARNDVLSSVSYPDGGAVSYLVNRQSQVIQFTDQRGVVHQYQFDLLGRQTEDLVTSLGGSSSSSSSSSSSGGPGGVDGTVQRIARTYEVRGLLQHVTSYSSPIIGEGTVVNDVERVYNSFEQLITEYQEHNGAVNTSTSVCVQYQYADGSSNAICATALVYPNGRVLTYSYGASGEIDDALGRIASLLDNDGVTHLADYTRIGRDTFVQQSSPEPQIAWSLINGSGADPYSGLDQFNRVVDNRWYSTATNGDLDRIQHGYDLASNRLWRKNTVADAAGVYLDELYGYDGIYRLAQMQRGQLNASNNGIVRGSLLFAQAWGLDATGNWGQFWENDSGSSWNLQQSRVANRANEITATIGGGWAQPTYDAAGNMAQMPQPSSPSAVDDATYDAWDRMMSIGSGGSSTQGHTYDGENRRITKVVSGSTRHYYFSWNWQSLEERLDSSAAADRQFVYGLQYIDDLVARDRGAERLYALTDGHWNVTGIFNASGAISERYAYAGYGLPTFMTDSFSSSLMSAYAWETLFTSCRWDSDAMRYAVRRRYFDALVGFWGTRDPSGYCDSQFNLYVLLSSNPIRFLDPSGLAIMNAVCTTHWESTCIEGYASGDPEITIPVAVPPATASNVCPAGWTFGGWRPLGGDESRLAKICATLKCPGCTVAACEKSVARLIADARKTTVWPFWIERCQAWVDAFSQRLPPTIFLNPCFSDTGQQHFTLGRGLSSGHAAYLVTFCDGTVAYFDIGAWGGGDHIFFGGDIPPGVIVD